LYQLNESLQHKKLSCRREAARCFISLNVSLRHSRSHKVVRNTAMYCVYKSLLVLHCNIVLFLGYSASNNGVTLKSGVRGHSRLLEMAPFYRSSFCWRSIVTMALCCISFALKRDIGRKSRFLLCPKCIRRQAATRGSSPLRNIAMRRLSIRCPSRRHISKTKQDRPMLTIKQ